MVSMWSLKIMRSSNQYGFGQYWPDTPEKFSHRSFCSSPSSDGSRDPAQHRQQPPKSPSCPPSLPLAVHDDSNNLIQEASICTVLAKDSQPLLAPQSGAHRRGAYRDFQPNPTQPNLLAVYGNLYRGRPKQSQVQRHHLGHV